MNYDEILDAVLLYSGLNPDEVTIDLEAIYPQALKRAEQIIFQEVELISQLKTTTLVANNNGRYPIPEDLGRMKAIRIYQKIIPFVDVSSILDYSYWDDPFASDIAYGISENEIVIGPDGGVGPVRIEYLKKHTPLTETTTNGIAEEYPQIYIDMLIYVYYLIMGYEQASGARESAHDLIDRANQNEIRKAR